MSSSEATSEPRDRVAFAELEDAVGRALARLSEVTQQASEAETRAAEFEVLVRRFTGDEAEAGLLLSRLRTLEEENVDLRVRLETGRDGVDRLLARIRFLEAPR